MNGGREDAEKIVQFLVISFFFFPRRATNLPPLFCGLCVLPFCQEICEGASASAGAAEMNTSVTRLLLSSSASRTLVKLLHFTGSRIYITVFFFLFFIRMGTFAPDIFLNLSKRYRLGCLIITSVATCSLSRPPKHLSVLLPRHGPASFSGLMNCPLSPYSDAEDWFCECPPLYTGRLCQFSACQRNPCSHGATCIPKSPLEAVCLCPYGRQGLLCEERECHSAAQINAV